MEQERHAARNAKEPVRFPPIFPFLRRKIEYESFPKRMLICQFDYPDDILARCEVLVAAVHISFRQSRDRMTKRLLDAIANPQVHILVHPLTLLIGSREPVEFDFERGVKAAVDAGVAMEINSQPSQPSRPRIYLQRNSKRGNFMTTSRERIEEDGDVCQNPACNCAIPAGLEYCDEYCRFAEVKPNSDYAKEQDIERGAGCRCGHADCQL